MILSEDIRSIVVGTAGLTVVALVAVVLTVARKPLDIDASTRRRVVVTFLIGIAFQTMHFLEELTTRFHDRFPLLFGLRPWSRTFFVGFNVAWLLVWLASVVALQSGYRLAYFPLWFLLLAMVANGIVHPLLSLSIGGYFPGLLTSPLVGVMGVVLWRQALQITHVREVQSLGERL